MKAYLVVDSRNVEEVREDLEQFPDNYHSVTGRVLLAPTASEAISEYCKGRVSNSHVFAISLAEQLVWRHTPPTFETIRKVE